MVVTRTSLDFNMIKVCNSLHMRKLFYSCRLRVSVPGEIWFEIDDGKQCSYICTNRSGVQFA